MHATDSTKFNQSASQFIFMYMIVLRPLRYLARTECQNFNQSTHSFLFVWEDNVSMESLYHKQHLTQCTRPFSQHLIWLHRDDCAEGKDEWMYIFHVEVVSSNGIRYGIVRETLGEVML